MAAVSRSRFRCTKNGIRPIVSRQTQARSRLVVSAAVQQVDRRRGVEYLTYALLVLFLTYYLAVGGSALGNETAVQIIGGAAGALLIWRYLSTRYQRPAIVDALELWLVAALAVFAITGVLAIYRRQALDVIITALAYLAALATARELLSEVRARTVLMTVFQTCCLALEVLIVLTWGGVALGFLRSTGFTVWPAANLPLPTWAWGQRHDLALFVVLLLPAFFSSRGWYRGRAFASVAVAMAVVIVMLDGSRNLWFAVAVAGGVVGLARTRRGLRERIRPWHVAALVTAVLGIGLAALVSGLATPLVIRLLDVTTVVARSGLWSASVTAWLQHPIAGWGVGSFPFLLQQTPYFEANSWAPLHPDSAIFQLLPEAGLLGLGAASCVLIGVAVTLRAARPVRWEALWALLVFLLGCLAANPTDFGFLIAVAICWLAYAAPQPPASAVSLRSRRWGLPPLKYVVPILVMLGFWLSSSVAAVFWDQARGDVSNGDLMGARRDAQTAAMLDPGEAIYHRGLGALLIAQGQPAAAVAELRQAAWLNPGDPITYRALAAAEERAGNLAGALQASSTAVQLQRSVPANLLLYARLLSEAGQATAAQMALAGVARISPTMLALPSWATRYAQIAAAPATLETAASQWAAGSPIMGDLTGPWLAVLADRQDLLDRLSETSPDLTYAAHALHQLARCDLVGAQADLSIGPTARYYDPAYWSLEAMLDVLAGRDPRGAYGAIEALTGKEVLTRGFTDQVSLLVDQSTFGLRDIWGYHRLGLGVDLPGFETPLASAASDLWLTDPTRAARAIDPNLALGMCPR
jgi:tetratricopeptide (TPR) repeat protein